MQSTRRDAPSQLLPGNDDDAASVRCGGRIGRELNFIGCEFKFILLIFV